MRARDLMTREVVTLPEDATVADAVAALTEHEVRHLPIVRDGEVIAVVSDRDLRRIEGLIALQISAPDAPVDVMGGPVMALAAADPVTLTEDVDIDVVIDAMLETRVGAVVIVDERSQLVGLVSYVDVLRAARGRLGG